VQVIGQGDDHTFERAAGGRVTQDLMKITEPHLQLRIEPPQVAGDVLADLQHRRCYAPPESLGGRKVAFFRHRRASQDQQPRNTDGRLQQSHDACRHLKKTLLTSHDHGCWRRRSVKYRTRLAYTLLAPSTWDQIVRDWQLSRRRLLNRRRMAVSLRGQRGLKLHLGCGSRVTPGWVNVDSYEQPGLDLRWDLRDALPVDAGAADLVYSEHVLEHLDFDDARALIRDIFRVLSPGGRLRLGVPDAELYLQAYVRGDDHFFRGARNIGNPVAPLDTPMKVINQMFRMGGAHRFAWDFETLARELTSVGFRDTRRYPSGQSPTPDLCLDDPTHAFETLYVEAER
jgi:predicted SAM-dependent methyltransferase